MIEIVVNGEIHQVPAGTTVTGLLAMLGVAPERVAVELNRSIIKNMFWGETGLRAGARVEIVDFVGGVSGSPDQANHLAVGSHSLIHGQQ